MLKKLIERILESPLTAYLWYLAVVTITVAVIFRICFWILGLE